MDMSTYLPFVIGWIVLLGLLTGVVVEMRRSKSRPTAPPSGRVPTRRTASSPDPETYPFIWGSPRYWSSYHNRDVAPPARQAMQLPPYHHEGAWLKVPGRYGVPF